MIENKKLLQDLSIILNCHQDIEDFLDEYEQDKTEKTTVQSLIKKIRKANGVIGKTVMRHLPE